jgi:hypothetical protein
MESFEDPVVKEILGLAAFASLRAEDESWLKRAFVAPNDFHRLSERNSILVIGKVGTGKTALRLAMQEAVKQNSERSPTLIVNWIPTPSDDRDLTGSALMQYALGQAFNAVIRSIFLTFMKEPERFENRPSWVEDALSWLIRRYVPGEPEFYIESREREFGARTTNWALGIVRRSQREILHKSASAREIIKMALNTIEELGFTNIWIVVDGLEKWSFSENEQTEKMIEAILSTLSLFEEPGFVFKLFLPEFMDATVTKASSIDRRRVYFYSLNWSPSEIRAIAEKRLQLATGNDKFSLEKLCSDKKFLEWLFQYGGKSPRACLSLLAPFVEAYIRERKVLTNKTWPEIARQNPPKFWVEQYTNRVFIGDHELSELSPNEHRILRYLYLNRHRTCSREEIYYLCIRNLEKKPSASEKSWEPETSWRGSFDAALSRLRAKFSRLDKNHTYITTVKSYGLKLDNYM